MEIHLLPLSFFPKSYYWILKFHHQILFAKLWFRIFLWVNVLFEICRVNFKKIPGDAIAYWTLNDQFSHCIETSQLIFIANQLSRCCIIRTWFQPAFYLSWRHNKITQNKLEMKSPQFYLFAAVLFFLRNRVLNISVSSQLRCTNFGLCGLHQTKSLWQLH